MSGDLWLRMAIVLASVAFVLRAVAAILAGHARAWYARRAEIGRYRRAGDRVPTSEGLVEKPWYVRVYDWGR